MTDRQCSTCQHGHSHSDGELYCHREPPKLVNTMPRPRSVFPWVKAWWICGEWKNSSLLRQ